MSVLRWIRVILGALATVTGASAIVLWYVSMAKPVNAEVPSIIWPCVLMIASGIIGLIVGGSVWSPVAGVALIETAMLYLTTQQGSFEPSLLKFGGLVSLPIMVVPGISWASSVWHPRAGKSRGK